MAEMLLQFHESIEGPDGTRYDARACGSELPGGTWQGWVEFWPQDGQEPLRTPRETTQPNRADTLYWASGLSAVYLEGALKRALAASRPAVRATPPQPPPFFDNPAAPLTSPSAVLPTESVLDPFAIYHGKGEVLLRKQLAALSAWHLVNIVRDYELSELEGAALNRIPASGLIEIIVDGVRKWPALPRVARQLSL